MTEFQALHVWGARRALATEERRYQSRTAWTRRWAVAK